MTNINRRSLITGLISFVAAPAIVRAESLMKLPKPQRVMTMAEYDDIRMRIIETYYPMLGADASWVRYTYDEAGRIFEIKHINPKDIYI